MEIDAVKDRVAAVCELLGGGLPYESSSIMAIDWATLADELADYARHIQVCCAKIAGYAGYAKRRANES